MSSLDGSIFGAPTTTMKANGDRTNPAGRERHNERACNMAAWHSVGPLTQALETAPGRCFSTTQRFQKLRTARTCLQARMPWTVSVTVLQHCIV